MPISLLARKPAIAPTMIQAMKPIRSLSFLDRGPPGPSIDRRPCPACRGTATAVRSIRWSPRSCPGRHDGRGQDDQNRDERDQDQAEALECGWRRPGRWTLASR